MDDLHPCQLWLDRTIGFALGVAVPLLCLLIIGCTESATAGRDDFGSLAEQPLEPFETVFAIRDTIEPGAAGAFPLVRVSGADGLGDLIAASDASEADVKIFDRNGTVVRRFGGRGEGPGEFLTPFGPRFDASGLLHVPDLRLNRITVFDQAGAVVRVVRITDLATMFDLEVSKGGNYVIAGISLNEDPEIAFVYSQLGERQKQYLPLRGRLGPNLEPSQVWRGMWRPSVAVRNDTVFAVASLLDSLWMINLRNDTIASIPLPVDPSELAIAPDDDHNFGDPRARMDWRRSFPVVAGVYVADSAVVVPYAWGIYFSADSSVVAVSRSADETKWTMLRDLPPILGGDEGDLLAILPDTINFRTRFVEVTQHPMAD